MQHMETKTYTIPLDSLGKVSKKLSNFQKKAEKYGKILEFSISNHFVIKINTPEYSFYLNVVNIVISYDLIVNEGWKILAHIEKTEAGNLVYNFGEENLAHLKLNDASLKCDHCNSNRIRNKAFIVVKNDEVKMVGSACLKEYTGIDPSLVCLFNSVLNVLEEVENDKNNNENEVFETSVVLTQAIKIFEENGWASASLNNSNKNKIFKALRSKKALRSNIHTVSTEALDMIFFFKNRKPTNDFEQNIQTICKNEYCNKEHFGFLAYVPVLYKKMLEETSKMNDNTSEFVGSVGSSIEFEVKSSVVVSRFQTDYGFVEVIKMTDENENVFVWFKSGLNTVEKGQICKGTVKEHKEYKGIKQTILTRCKAKK